MDVLLFALVLAVSTLVAWKGSNLLESSAQRLSTRYRLPAIVHGTLVVAVGSSFPELTTTITASLIHGEFALGMASIVGSAIFNILVIPGISGWMSGSMRFDIRLVYRDAQFYLTSVAVLLLAFSFALIYEPLPGDALSGTMTRTIALVPIGLYGLYLFLQHQEMQSGDDAKPDPDDQRLEGSATRDWLSLLLGMGLVVAGVEGLLRTAIFIGDVLGTPSFIWGATVVAAATSVPDAIISLRAAKRGEGDLSVGNVLGSNIFDLLVAIPAGVLVAGSVVINFGVAAPLMAALTLATIILFAMMRTGLDISRMEASLLLVLYAVFLAWLMLETFGVSSLLRGVADG